MASPKVKKKRASRKTGKPIGAPAMYKTPEELEEKILEYFAGGFRKKKMVKDGLEIEVPMITISDLVIFLGFSDRHSFYQYERKPGFTHTIKKARSFIEREYEEMLRLGNCTGAIFALKNFGWTDRTEVAHTGDLKINYGHRKRN